MNVCFDTDNHTTLIFQPPPLNLSNKISNEKIIQIELVDKNSSDSSAVNEQKILINEKEESPLKIVEDYST